MIMTVKLMGILDKTRDLCETPVTTYYGIPEISKIQKEISSELKNGPLSQAKLDEFSQRLAACGGVRQAVCLPDAVLNL